MRKYLIQLALLFLLAAPALGAITVDGTGTATANATSIGVAVTAGSVAAGDVLMIFLGSRVEVAGEPDRFVPPAGWALLEADTDDAPSASQTAHVTTWIFVRVADASDVSKPTYTFSPFVWVNGSTANVAQTGMLNAHIIAITGMNTKYWLDDHRANITITASGTLTAPPVSSYSSAGDAQLIFWVFDQAAAGITITTPSGFTSQPAGILSNTAASPDLYSQLFFNATPTVTNSYTASTTSAMSAGTGSSVGISFTLLPAGVQPYGVVEEPFQVGNIAKPPPLPPDAGSHATYYVDSNVAGYNGQAAPTSTCLAHDGMAGTSTGTAWCTLAHVKAQTFVAGDEIIFKCGDTWRESLVPPSSGSSTANIYFTVDPTGAWGACTYGTPAATGQGFVSGNLPIITGSDIIGTTGNIITSAWTQCGVSDANCETSANGSITNVWWQNINTLYGVSSAQSTGGAITCKPSGTTCGAPIQSVFVSDVTPACAGPACPANSISPPWGLTRAADLPGAATAAPGPLAVDWGAGSANSNGGADNQGSAEIGAMAAGSYVYYENPSPDVATNTGPGTLTMGRLYVWLGDSSSPNSHTIEAGVREFNVGGPQGIESGFGKSYLTFNGLNLTRAPFMIFGYNLSQGSGGLRSGQRYNTVQWVTGGEGEGIVDANTSYHNAIQNQSGTNWLLRHTTVAYSGDHGNDTNMQNMDYTTLEYQDQSHGNHDECDHKGVDGAIVRYSIVHDGISEPSYYSAASPNSLQGSYFESAYPEKSSWSAGFYTNGFAPIGINVYFDEYYNFVPGSGRPGPSAIHLDTVTGPGAFIANNSMYANAQTHTTGVLYLVGTAAQTTFNIYCNAMTNYAVSTGSGLQFSGAGTINEDADNLGLLNTGAAGTASLATGSLGPSTIKNDPKYNHPSTVYDLSPIATSPNLNSCNTAKGLASYIGAFAQPQWSFINAANGPTFP